MRDLARRVLAALLAGLLPASSLAASSTIPNLPPCPPGWDHTKWVDPNVTSPKYVVGRIIAKHPHTPNGLKAAIPEIEKAFPGSKHIDDNSDDKADIPCVGIIDLVVAADGPDVGTAWAWQVVQDKCGACTPRLCTPMPPETNGPGGGAANVPVPPQGAAVKAAVAGAPDAVALQQDPKKCGSGEYLERVVAELRRKDPKFGFNCVNPGAQCIRTSRDSVAYYYGTDAPYEGARNVKVIKVIKGRCTAQAAPAWEVLTIDGAWTNRGRHMTGDSGSCTWSNARECVDGMSFDIRTPNGDCAGDNPGDGFQRRPELPNGWVRPLGPC